MLKEEVEKYLRCGKKNIRWVVIVKCFPGRSTYQLKNWWNNAKAKGKKNSKKHPPTHGDVVKETA
jgi:hypothetical protein